MDNIAWSRQAEVLCRPLAKSNRPDDGRHLQFISPNNLIVALPSPLLSLSFGRSKTTLIFDFKNGYTKALMLTVVCARCLRFDPISVDSRQRAQTTGLIY